MNAKDDGRRGEDEDRQECQRRWRLPVVRARDDDALMWPRSQRGLVPRNESETVLIALFGRGQCSSAGAVDPDLIVTLVVKARLAPRRRRDRQPRATCQKTMDE